MHQSIPAASTPSDISIFFLPWMANSRGWGFLSCQIPRVGTKKEGKCPVLVNTATFFIDRTVEWSGYKYFIVLPL